MNAQHTPGPWLIEKCRCGHSACKQYTLSNQRAVGFELEDARLIAAAPELLATLESARAVLIEHYAAQENDYPLDRINAAIAKAKGETQ